MAGSARISPVEGVSIDVPAGATVTGSFDDGVLLVSYDSGSQPITVTVDGSTVSLLPGEVLILPGGCLGDQDGDGLISMLDIRGTARALPSSPSDRRWSPTADHNRDGQVSIDDLRIVLRAFRNTSCPHPAPGPLDSFQVRVESRRSVVRSRHARAAETLGGVL